jgi:DNA-directed RNA polymerase specialized sigma24 family protein
MSPNDQSTPLKLDLKGFTAKQYAALILKEELGYSYGRAGLRMGINYRAFARLYNRAKVKRNDINDR